MVRQRLKLACVSPVLHEVYANDDMTLDQLMAFTVSEDHVRQEHVWELVQSHHNQSAHFIRARLNETTVPARDPRALFVGIDTYVAGGGCVVRDLFEEDRGGWLQDAALLDRLVLEKLGAEADRIRAEGWKWVEAAIDLPYGYHLGMRPIEATHTPPTEAELAEVATLQAEAEALEGEWSGADEIPDDVDARVNALDERIAELAGGNWNYDPAEMAMAGVFLTIERNGELSVDPGWVRAEDEPVVESYLHGKGEGEQRDDGVLGDDCHTGLAPDGSGDEVQIEEEDAGRTPTWRVKGPVQAKARDFESIRAARDRPCGQGREERVQNMRAGRRQQAGGCHVAPCLVCQNKISGELVIELVDLVPPIQDWDLPFEQVHENRFACGKHAAHGLHATCFGGIDERDQNCLLLFGRPSIVSLRGARYN